jgi:hypothetical protein
MKLYSAVSRARQKNRQERIDELYERIKHLQFNCLSDGEFKAVERLCAAHGGKIPSQNFTNKDFDILEKKLASDQAQKK